MVCDITTGLVALWKFSNNYNDSSGNGHTLTNSGTTFTTDKNFVANQAVLFDGNDYLSIAHNSVFTTTAFSTNIWLYVVQATTTQYFFFKDQSGNVNHDWNMVLVAGGMNVQMQNGSSVDNLVVSTVATGWHMFTYTSNGLTDHKLYCDKIICDTSVLNWTINGNTQTIYLGGWATTAPLVNGSKIDEVRWYNRIIDQDTIDALYDGYDAPSCPTGVTPKPVFFASDL